MAESAPELSAQEQVFVEEYAKDRNGVRSALAAGFGKSYTAASEQARQLLQKPVIRYWLRRVWGVQSRRLKTAPSDVVREWAIIGKSDLTDYVVDAEGRVSVAPGVPRSALRAVKKVKQLRTERLTGPPGRQELVVELRTEIELHGKDNALASLYDHFGALPGGKPEGGGESLGIDVLGRLGALRAARRPEPGGAGPALGPAPVEPEPGAAGGSVP